MYNLGAIRKNHQAHQLQAAGLREEAAKLDREAEDLDSLAFYALDEGVDSHFQEFAGFGLEFFFVKEIDVSLYRFIYFWDIADC